MRPQLLANKNKAWQMLYHIC